MRINDSSYPKIYQSVRGYNVVHPGEEEIVYMRYAEFEKRYPHCGKQADMEPHEWWFNKPYNPTTGIVGDELKTKDFKGTWSL